MFVSVGIDYESRSVIMGVRSDGGDRVLKTPVAIKQRGNTRYTTKQYRAEELGSKNQVK